MDGLADLGLEIHQLVLKRDFSLLLDRIDQFWAEHPLRSVEEQEILLTYLVSGYRIVALHLFDESVADGDAVMKRALEKYPELAEFKKIRYQLLKRVGDLCEPALLAEAKALASASRVKARKPKTRGSKKPS